jgi:hypothetical protein
MQLCYSLEPKQDLDIAIFFQFIAILLQESIRKIHTGLEISAKIYISMPESQLQVHLQLLSMYLRVFG